MTLVLMHFEMYLTNLFLIFYLFVLFVTALTYSFHIFYRHNNQTGRWLSIFRATWLPNSDDIFVVGSLQDYPRRIQLYNKDLNVCHLLKHENLTTITSNNAFHPFVPSLAGGNSFGKVFVFT